jgi:hypothetical protein
MSKYQTLEMSFMVNNWEKKMYLNFSEVFMGIAGDTCNACSIFYQMPSNSQCLLKRSKS